MATRCPAICGSSGNSRKLVFLLLVNLGAATTTSTCRGIDPLGFLYPLGLCSPNLGTVSLHSPDEVVDGHETCSDIVTLALFPTYSTTCWLNIVYQLFHVCIVIREQYPRMGAFIRLMVHRFEIYVIKLSLFFQFCCFVKSLEVSKSTSLHMIGMWYPWLHMYFLDTTFIYLFYIFINTSASAILYRKPQKSKTKCESWF